MGWFTPKVPNTISDKQRASLNRRGQKKEPPFSRKAIARRKVFERQRVKARWS
jgi:hypothetical protein